MSNAKRILLFQEGAADAAAPLRAHLADEGFEVTSARTFLEAAPFLAVGRTDLFLFYLPEQEWVRNAILNETRRANPSLPIVAIAANASDELLQFLTRFQVAGVLSADGDARHIIDRIGKELESSKGGGSGAAARPSRTGVRR